ncbi:MAG TPA: hypothetical protein VHP55_12725 [Usitatibacter sp.]|jgi:hypothetical protein|nr:hypothetical protein [Usitatibacter sp.]
MTCVPPRVLAVSAATLLLAFALPAHAYCIHNQLKDREVAIEQEEHPDPMRNDRRMRTSIPPGGQVCCAFHQLDCNPTGRENGLVGLRISIAGEPAYACALDRRDPFVKVTGAGTIRIQPNPRHSSNPYIARVFTREGKDLTGPRGLACTESKGK